MEQGQGSPLSQGAQEAYNVHPVARTKPLQTESDLSRILRRTNEASQAYRGAETRLRDIVRRLAGEAPIAGVDEEEPKPSIGIGAIGVALEEIESCNGSVSELLDRLEELVGL